MAQRNRNDFDSTGDSSDADDGTGDTGDNLFNGWSGDAPSGYTSHSSFHLNASFWLAKAQ